MPPIKLPQDKRIYVLLVLFFCSFFYAFAFSAPRNFPKDSIVTLEKGSGLATLSKELEEKGVIRSEIWFRVIVITLAGEGGIQAGDYYLRDSQSAVSLAWRMTRGDHGLKEAKITVPEGFTVEEIAKLFDSRFVLFNKEKFLRGAREGYMFPDTYFIKLNSTAEDVLELFRNNYESKVAPLRSEMAEFGKTEDEIIKMASIIEGEVKTWDDKRLVSGILWKRLSIGMALQVDADPNTYEEPGLPKAPINNPGLESIRAAMSPEKSPYFYFLNAKSDGTTYFAETLDEHIVNIREHL